MTQKELDDPERRLPELIAAAPKKKKHRDMPKPVRRRRGASRRAA